MNALHSSCIAREGFFNIIIMLHNILSYIFMFGLLTPLAMSRHVQFYRKDYNYVEKFDAFYKLHWDMHGLSWNSAFLTCRDEGAQLFYPKTEGEWTIVKNLTGSLDVVPNVTDIFVGIHDDYGLGSFITVDGHSTPVPLFDEQDHRRSSLETKGCIMMDMETGGYKIVSCERPSDEPAPYICKKLDDESCPTIDRGYKFMKENKKCYKVNEKKRTWQEAMHTCFMEGAILTVIDNDAEANIIKAILYPDKWYYVGFRKVDRFGDFFTVTGEEILDHYIQWYNQQYDQDQKQCGAVYLSGRTLYTGTEECYTQLPFICEMELKS